MYTLSMSLPERQISIMQGLASIAGSDLVKCVLKFLFVKHIFKYLNYLQSGPGIQGSRKGNLVIKGIEDGPYHPSCPLPESECQI